jgi:hypothetical protein
VSERGDVWVGVEGCSHLLTRVQSERAR